MKTILITGANGYLGRNLLEQLKHESFHVQTLTRDKNRMKINYPEWTHYDLRDFENGEIPFKDIDIVLHAAFARAKKGGKAIAESMEFTRKLIERVTNYRRVNFINISTQEVYGSSPAPWKESDEPQPNTMYGMAKYYTELLTHSILKKHSLNYTNIRLAGVIGKDTEERMVNKFVCFAMENRELNIQGGKQTFSQIYSHDVVAGIMALINTSTLNWLPVYNLGYTSSYSIMEIANIVKEVGENNGIPHIHINRKESDVILTAVLDSSQFYKETGWKPKRDMKIIVKEIFESKIKV